MRDYNQSKKRKTSLKTYILLMVVLALNTLRYGGYLLEDSTSIYNWILFVLNLASLLVVLFLSTKKDVDAQSG
ncbi:hypothetical protein [Lentibacillus saliphilus]|uniref:hypothetical protein n=1 Tax=Lentibacillus saliphilus TaxID=2737028 RepID=UPI001C2F6829|nr:hypothetical protein [Lentibacillus saliphilus]